MAKVIAEFEQTLNYTAVVEQTHNYTADIDFLSVFVVAIWLLATNFRDDTGAWLDSENWND